MIKICELRQVPESWDSFTDQEKISYLDEQIKGV